MKRIRDRQNERGTSVAEFAVVALLFFTLIFGIIEFGRLLYTHNALTDATRRGARCACTAGGQIRRSEEHTSELQSQSNIVCRLLLEKKNLNAHGNAYEAH